MKSYLLPFVCLLLIVSCRTQKGGTGSDLKEVSIVNVGELLSTYDLKKDTAATRAINDLKMSSTAVEELYKHSVESGWPAGLNTLSNRAKNMEAIKTYKAYQLTSFLHATRGTLYILKIPKDQNSGMTGDLALSNDIYFVMTGKGFTVK